MVKSADTRDLKSLGSNTVPVQIRSAAPGYGPCAPLCRGAFRFLPLLQRQKWDAILPFKERVPRKKGELALVIFDLDGTLYRTHETTLPAFEAICQQYQLPLTEEDKNFLLYTTTQSLLNRLAPDMPPDQQAAFREKLKQRELQAVKESGHLYDQVGELLSSLFHEGVELAICGMGNQEYIEAVLEHCQIRQYFSYISYRIGNRTKGEALAELLSESHKTPEQCILVGDSITDLNAARENHVPFIGVGYGYGAKEIAQADFIAENVAQLGSLLHYMMIYQRITRDLSYLPKPVTVGINGVDTSGKSVFAYNLERFLKSQGAQVELLHLDDFHNPRAIRSLDRSPQGYIDHAFNLEALAELISSAKKSSRAVNLDLLDLDQDTYTKNHTYHFTKDTIVLVEGVLLFRPPLDKLFDYKIFLDISFQEVLRRAAKRDVPKYGDAILDRYKQRYIPAQQIYFKQFDPIRQAQMVIDNTNFSNPRMQFSSKTRRP